MIKMRNKSTNKPVKGRGTTNRVDARYLDMRREEVDDGWEREEERESLHTTVTVEKPKTIITHNQSPDVPFDTSINAYRGCEHGCIYCFARPTHAYLDLSPGVDFETRLFAKPNASELLLKEISKPGYQCKTIALGTNTDPYQPIESNWKITREIIDVLHKADHPLSIVTKSHLVERDIDMLSAMAAKGLASVFISVTTLDHGLARRMEPRAASPQRRLETIKKLYEANIPVGILFAPVIPVLNDTEMEQILEQTFSAGARQAGYVMLRLPHEIKLLFKEWLEFNYPLKAEHVMNRIRDIRGGRENDPNFGSRQRGEGIYADLIEQRFQKVCNRLGFNQDTVHLKTELFRPPVRETEQIDLF